eukprot:186812-Amphidinium_carterae.1
MSRVSLNWYYKFVTLRRKYDVVSAAESVRTNSISDLHVHDAALHFGGFKLFIPVTLTHCALWIVATASLCIAQRRN